MPFPRADINQIPQENLISFERERGHLSFPMPLAGTVAYQAAALSGEYRDYNNFVQAKNDLETRGGSPILERVENTLRAREVDRTAMRFEDLLASGLVGPENWDEFLIAYDEGRSEAREGVSIEREFIDRMRAQNDEGEPAYTVEARRTWLDFLDQDMNALDDIEAQAQSFLAQSNTSGPRAVGEFLMLIVPFLEQHRLSEMADALGVGRSGIINTVVDFVLPGFVLERVRDKFHGLDPVARREFMSAMLEAIDEQATFFDFRNDFFRYEMLTRVMDDSWQAGFDWDKTFTNLVGVIDAVYVGRLARTAINGVRGMGRTPIERLALNNPRAARKAMNDALKDSTGESMAALTGGRTPTDALLNYIYPNPRGVTGLKAGPAEIADFQANLKNEIMAIMARTESAGYAFTAAEKAASETNTIRRLQETRSPHAHMNKSEVAADSEGLDINIMWGRNEDVGFTTYAEAMSRARATMTAEELATLQIYRRNHKTGELERLSKKERARLEGIHADLAHQSRRLGSPASARVAMERARTDAPEQLAAATFNYEQRLASASNIGEIDALITRAMSEAPEQVPALRARRASMEADHAGLESALNRVEAELGEYFFKGQYRHNFSAVDSLGFAPTDIGTGGILRMFFGGDMMKYFQDPAARFSQHISTMAGRAGDRAIDLEKSLLELVTPAWRGLSDESKTRIFSLFGRAEKQNLEQIKWSWVRGEMPDITTQELKAFVALQSAADAMYLLHNRRLIRDLNAGGYRQVIATQADGSEFKNAATVLSDGMARNLDVAWNPALGREVRLTADEVDELYRGGGSIGKLWSPWIEGRSRYNFIIIDPRNGTRLDAIPVNALQYRAGYIPRMWKGAYFIRVSHGDIFVDGVRTQDTGRAVMVTNSRSEAERVIREMNEGEAKLFAEAAERGEVYHQATYDFRIGKEMLDKEAFAADMAIMEQQGRLFYSKRGEGLRIVNGDMEDHLVQPVEAVLRGIRATAQIVEQETVVSGLKNSFVKTYSDITNSPGKMPATVDGINDTSALNSVRAFQAKNMYGYIRFLEGAEPDQVNSRWRYFIQGVSEFFDRQGWTRAASWSLDRQKDPMSIIRAIGFYAYLGMNPVRQYVLQTQQVLMLTSWNPKYMPLMLRDKAVLDGAFSAMLMARSSNKTISELGEKLYAKNLSLGARALGISEKEVDGMVHAFRNSGLPASVDHNMLVHDGIWAPLRDAAQSNLAKGYQTIADIGKLPFKVMKVLGFDRGEFNNLAYTWLTVRNRWLRENPGGDVLSRAAQDEIAGKARQLALSMTRVGSFGYQRGWFSLATQFLSIQHKAFLAMLPESIGGSKGFSAAEKRGFAISNAIVWGSSGFGAREIYMHFIAESGIEFTDEPIISWAPWMKETTVNEFLEGGFQEMAINAIVSAISGTDSRVASSQDLAPASGIVETPVEILRAIFGMEKSMQELFLGPVGQLVTSSRNPTTGIIGGRIGMAIDQARVIMGSEGTEAIDATELQQVMDAGMRLLPFYNNYMRMKYAFETGRLVNTRGDKTAHVTHGEAFIRGVFGVRSVAEIEYGELMYTLTERRTALRETADIYYDRQMQNLARWNSNPDEYEEIRAAIRLESYIMRLGDDFDRSVMMERILERARQAPDRGEEDLAYRIASAAGLGIPINAATRARIHNSRLPPEQKQALLDLIDYAIAEVDAFGTTDDK